MHVVVLIGQSLFDIFLKLAYCVHEMSVHKFSEISFVCHSHYNITTCAHYK